MALGVLIALFQSPLLALLAAVVGVGGHALDAYVLGPRVQGRATRLHPLAAMAALLVGAELGGILGALFAVPLAGVANVYLGAMFRARRGEGAFVLPQGDNTIADLPGLDTELDQAAER
jgi:predicted PurR-regulated permease PerM